MSEKDAQNNMRQCENDDTWYDVGEECPKCLEAEERAKRMFADRSGSGKPDSHRDYVAWKLKRGGY